MGEVSQYGCMYHLYIVLLEALYNILFAKLVYVFQPEIDFRRCSRVPCFRWDFIYTTENTPLLLASITFLYGNRFFKLTTPPQKAKDVACVSKEILASRGIECTSPGFLNPRVSLISSDIGFNIICLLLKKHIRQKVIQYHNSIHPFR